MKIVTLSDAPNRDTRKTRELLEELGVPYATAPIGEATVIVRNVDRSIGWTGFMPHLIRRHCPLGGL